MVMNLVNMFSQVLSPMQNVQSTKMLPVSSSTSGGNPFANPFMSSTASKGYGHNAPVKGGYFAGYYNGKQNIVGSRLFVEV